ncbi:LOW QUALITY PROTEIN: testis-expressed protein 15 [Theristicus caerulescens]
MLSAKAAFTETRASMAPRASFFGPEHVFFEAAKSRVGKDRRMSFEKAAEEEKDEETVETHVEAVVMCEMVHFLKNSIAKKVGAERFRSLWFDLSFLPELLHCQEQMASFSLLKDHSREPLGRTVALAISGSQLDHNHNRLMELLGRLK